MSKKLSNSVLRKIKKNKIKPRPKWHFLIKNILFWTVFGLCVILGAKAVGITLFALTESHFLFIAKAHGPIFLPWLRIFPFPWLIFFLLFLLLASYGLHHTKKGYKLSTTKLVKVNLLLSLILGIVSCESGLAENFERNFHPPFYKNIEQRQKEVWSNPQEGRLAGTIIEIKNDQTLLLDDFNQKRWVVDYQESQMQGEATLQPEEKIRLVGEIISENNFKAEIIGPWGKPKPRMMKENHKPPRTK